MTTKKILVVSFLGILLAGASACSKHDSTSMAQHSPRYFCPMHPHYTSDKPGDCPICNMRLVPMHDDDAAPSGKRTVLYYRNPMNPAVTSPVPSKDNMGMDYVPVYSDEAMASVPLEGQATVNVSAGSQQLIGVRVSSVTWRDLHSVIRASARVAYDPALFAAIQEHQEAVLSLSRTAADSPFRQEAVETFKSSKLRLRQAGLSVDQIARVSRPGFDPANLLLGKAGGTVWVYVDLYDYEASRVKPGQRVDLTSQAFPGKTIHGTVRSIDAIVSSETRTLRARIEAPNPDGELKPDLYVDAAIQASLGRKLSIPDSALLDTGTRQLVYVQTAPGHFEPREVQVGQQAEGFYEVMRGVREGEQVVTTANFLIDSESKLRAAAQAPQASPSPMREGTKSTEGNAQ